ncbi:DMT family transporter [Candidatus Woesearchaeota archaeon]|nr:DMT family transporter [Candidatus Woesearchaeota archaeon]
MKKTILGTLFICTAAVLWGFDGVVLTPRLFNLSVPFVVFLLHFVPFVFLQPFMYKSYGKIFAMKREGWLMLFLVAFFGGLIGTFAIVKALFLVNFDHLSVVVLLQKLQPLFAIILAVLILKERLSKHFLAWASLAIVGAYLVAFGFAAPALGASLTAVILAIVAAASFGASTVFSKKLIASLDFKSATFGRYGMTTLLSLLYLFIAGVGLPFSTVSPLNWLFILIIGIFTGVGALFLYYAGLTRVKASVSTICELCLPLSAVVFDWLINGSVLGPWQWLGAVILIGAIVKISTGQTSPRARSSTQK